MVITGPSHSVSSGMATFRSVQLNSLICLASARATVAGPIAPSTIGVGYTLEETVTVELPSSIFGHRFNWCAGPYSSDVPSPYRGEYIGTRLQRLAEPERDCRRSCRRVAPYRNRGVR